MSSIRSYRNIKDATMTLRCTKEEKERIVKKAKQNEKSTGEYLLDAAIAGCERNSKKTSKRIAQMVAQQEALNRLYESIQSVPEETKRNELLEKFEEVTVGGKKLWDYC